MGWTALVFPADLRAKRLERERMPSITESSPKAERGRRTTQSPVREAPRRPRAYPKPPLEPSGRRGLVLAAGIMLPAELGRAMGISRRWLLQPGAVEATAEEPAVAARRNDARQSARASVGCEPGRAERVGQAEGDEVCK
jgi:hypothetical protein